LHSKDEQRVFSAHFRLPTWQLRSAGLQNCVQNHPSTGISLHVQDAPAPNYTLQLGAAAEIVTVEGGASPLNTQDATVSTTIDRNFAENLPSNGRSFNARITLSPGVALASSESGRDAGQFSVNGQRTGANNVFVDGVSANFGMSVSPAQSVSGGLPAFTALGATDSLVLVVALQKFTLHTSGYRTEYGRTPGGQISFRARSGTNAFHGCAFEYFRNDSRDANNWSNDGLHHNSSGAERQNDFGGTFDGPFLIDVDKAFFFLSYEGMRLRLPATGDSIRNLRDARDCVFIDREEKNCEGRNQNQILRRASLNQRDRSLDTRRFLTWNVLRRRIAN
jgi:hypothetical protein